MDPATPYNQAPYRSDDDGAYEIESDDATSPIPRRQPPSQQDWARVKPIFAELYIDQGRRLKDVQRILLQRHNFHATTKMYKTRIKSWRLKKYVKASEKERIATFIRDNDIKGDTLQKLKFNGRPARLDLVRRYCKRTGVHEDVANALPTKALEEHLTRVSERAAEGAVTPNSTLPTPPGSARRRGRSVSSPPADITPTRTSISDPAETVTWYLQQYLEWQLAPLPAASIASQSEVVLADAAAFSTVQSDQSASNAATFFEKLLLGLDTLADQSLPQGWHLVHQACEQAQFIVAEQYRGFVRLLIISFTDERWARVPGLRTELLKYLADISSTVLGEDHDLSCILRLLKSEHILESAAEPMLRAMTEILSRGRSSVDDELCAARRSLADLLRRRQDFEGAIRIGNDMCVESQTLRGPNHDSTRRAIRRLADTYLDQGRREIARGGYQEVLNRSVTNQSPDSPTPAGVTIDEATIFSLQALCEIDRSRAGFKAKDLPFDDVLSTVLTDLGASKEDVMSCLATWCQPLTLRRRWLGSNQYGDRLLARWAISRS